jgi:hypothetical protein
MDFERELSTRMQNAGGNPRTGKGAAAAVERARQRAQRRRSAMSFAIVIAMVGAGGWLLSQASTAGSTDPQQIEAAGPGDVVGTASSRGVLASDDLVWSVTESPAGDAGYGTTLEADNGTFYLLGSPLAAEVPDDAAPQAYSQFLYSSEDGANWSIVDADVNWISAIAIEKNVLYALGVRTDADDPEELVSGTSIDGGETWVVNPLPPLAARNTPAAVSPETPHVALVRSGGLSVATVQSIFEYNWNDVLPESLRLEDSDYYASTGGLVVEFDAGELACPAPWTIQESGHSVLSTVTSETVVSETSVPGQPSLESAVTDSSVPGVPLSTTTTQGTEGGASTTLVPTTELGLEQAPFAPSACVLAWSELGLDAPPPMVSERLLVSGSDGVYSEVAWPFADQGVGELSGSDGLFVALTYPQSEGGSVLVWTSQDGRVWAPVDLPDGIGPIYATGVLDGSVQLVTEGVSGSLSLVRLGIDGGWTAAEVPLGVGDLAGSAASIQVSNRGVVIARQSSQFGESSTGTSPDVDDAFVPQITLTFSSDGQTWVSRELDVPQDLGDLWITRTFLASDRVLATVTGEIQAGESTGFRSRTYVGEFAE